MSEVTLNTSSLGNGLSSLLTAQDIQPGDEPSYQLCKTIYTLHPLGAKIADNPLKMAQSQERKISVQNGPEDRLKEAFLAQWKADGCDRHAFQVASLARVYGAASLTVVSDGTPPDRPLRFESLADAKIGFNVVDPLNTAGSLVLNQDPNSIDFMKVMGISVGGKAYHRSRTVTLFNEAPIYIDFTQSSFGYTGRSVYQRALFPLKSFVNTQITNDMIASKAGLLVVMMKSASSVIDGLMAAVGAVKRTLLKIGVVGQVLQIGSEDKVESLNLQNLDGAFGMARKNILEDIASSAGTPAQVINSETFAEGFGEGEQDAAKVAQFIQGIRLWMDPVYDFLTRITQYRAWNEQFYETLKADFPEYKSKTYRQFFYEVTNSFAAAWPSLIEEPDSEKIKVEDTSLKAMIAIVEVGLPVMDPENKANLMQWVVDNVNSMKLLFPSQLQFDRQAFEEYVPPQPVVQPQEPKPEAPFSARDSQVRRLPAAA